MMIKNNYTFLFQEEFIKETDSEINLPMLCFKYKITDKYKLPTLNKKIMIFIMKKYNLIFIKFPRKH